jgi:hypothetical protein
MLWQLKKISTGESLNEPQNLPENWGPIFGMSGIVDKLGDLSWLGNEYLDRGWFVVGEGFSGPTPASESEIQWEKAKQLLKESDWAVLSDIPMTSGDKALWMEYRRALREIRLQTGFPSSIVWPYRPD